MLCLSLLLLELEALSSERAPASVWVLLQCGHGLLLVYAALQPLNPAQHRCVLCGVLCSFGRVAHLAAALFTG